MKKNPVAFLGREMGPEMQRAYAVANLLNVEGKLTPAIFDKIHPSARSPEPCRREADLRGQRRAGRGVRRCRRQLRRLRHGLPVRPQHRELQQCAVPAFLVNSKYMVKIESITSETVQPAGEIPAGEERRSRLTS